MTQLELPFNDPKGVRVEELSRSSQYADVLALAQGFAADVDLDEYIDADCVLKSCILINQDYTRKHTNLFIAYDGDTPIGFLVGVTTTAFHRPTVVAEQKLWYVSQTARGGVAAKKLMQAYEDWARLNGATQIFTGTANRRYAERTSKLLEHLGYARCGALHVKEI